MSRDYNRGDVDYDYDMYRNRIRKYVVSGFVGKFRERTPVWSQVHGFCTEKGLSNLKRDVDGSYFSEAPVQKTKKEKK